MLFASRDRFLEFPIHVRISEALAGWQVVEFPGEYYQILKSKGDNIFAILKAFGMELKPQLYTRVAAG